MGGNYGGSSGGGRTPGRGPANRVQVGDEGGRSQGGDMRDPEQEEPGGTQATAITVAHGGADGGRSHGGGMAADSRGPTNGGGAGEGGARDREPKSKGDGEDSGDLGEADGAGDRPGGVDPGGRGGAEGMKEPDGARGTRRSRRSGVPRCRMVDARPRRSQRAEAESGPWRRSRGKLRPRRRWRMAVARRSHRIDGGLRVSRGAARRQRWRRQEWV